MHADGVGVGVELMLLFLVECLLIPGCGVLQSGLEYVEWK